MTKRNLVFWHLRKSKVFLFLSLMVFPGFAMDQDAVMVSLGELRKLSQPFELTKGEKFWYSCDYRPKDAKLAGVLGSQSSQEPKLPLKGGEYFQTGGVPLKSDESERVEQSGHECWRGVGLLTWKFGERSHSATAFLFSPNLVMTTASNVYDFKNKQWAEDLQFTPGRNGDIALHSPVNCVWKAVFPEWVKGGNPYEDMAILQLSEDVGDTIGWYGLVWASNDIIDRLEPINLIGYPNDKLPEASLWWNSSQAQKCYDNQISITVSAGPGYNGAPAWVRSDQLVDGYYVVGVLASGAPVEKADPDTRTYERVDGLNFATRITQEKLLRIQQAIKSN